MIINIELGNSILFVIYSLNNNKQQTNCPFYLSNQEMSKTFLKFTISENG